MKSLDEVIEILQRQIDKTRIKILDKDLLDSVPDALHYLKTIETTENLYHDAVNELSKWIEEDWKDRCLPLTWDELKQMEGKPVWVEVKYQNPDAIYKYWTIVKYFDSHEGEDLVFTGTGFYHRSLLGTDWQAYRKERK